MQEYFQINGLYQANFHPGAVVPDFAMQVELFGQLPDKRPEADALYFAADAQQ